jgi:hypothetical protein
MSLRSRRTSADNRYERERAVEGKNQTAECSVKPGQHIKIAQTKEENCMSMKKINHSHPNPTHVLRWSAPS